MFPSVKQEPRTPSPGKSRTLSPEKPLADTFSEAEGSPDSVDVQQATVYEAVAGNITQSGSHDTKVAEQKHTHLPLRPDEVLFSTQNAPPQYQEKDYYFAHRDLPSGQRLPSGDLLNALHEYVSKLYGRMQEVPDSWTSMDETALIALGFLLEEAAKETLGKTGALALVEGEGGEERKRFIEHDERTQVKEEPIEQQMKEEPIEQDQHAQMKEEPVEHAEGAQVEQELVDYDQHVQAKQEPVEQDQRVKIKEGPSEHAERVQAKEESVENDERPRVKEEMVEPDRHPRVKEEFVEHDDECVHVKREAVEQDECAQVKEV